MKTIKSPWNPLETSWNDENSLYQVAISSATVKVYISPWKCISWKSSCSCHRWTSMQRPTLYSENSDLPGSNGIWKCLFSLKISPVMALWKISPLLESSGLFWIKSARQPFEKIFKTYYFAMASYFLANTLAVKQIKCLHLCLSFPTGGS